jgi:hypothetical protein
MKPGKLDTAGLQALAGIAWRRASAYHLESSCGRYTIDRVMAGETPRYTLWRLDPPRSPRMVALFDSSDEAKAAVARLGEAKAVAT